jgi:hypothetical protein
LDHDWIATVDELPDLVIAGIDDINGRIVAYERRRLPFSEAGRVTQIIASLKTISEDGNFEIRNLMRENDTVPTTKLRAVIDRDLFHRPPGRIPAGDIVEFG